MILGSLCEGDCGRSLESSLEACPWLCLIQSKICWITDRRWESDWSSSSLLALEQEARQWARSGSAMEAATTTEEMVTMTLSHMAESEDVGDEGCAPE